MDEIILHPAYFPSILQMVAIAQAEKVCFEVWDNYQKQTYRNRAHIAHANGKLVLTVPIQHSKDGARQTTRNVQPENNFPWQEQHWKSLQTAYRTSPYFEFYEDELLPFFTKPVSSLLDHNMDIYVFIAELIGLDTPYERTASYQELPAGRDLRGLVNAKSKNVPSLSKYIQVLEANHGFLPNLSVLDLLFNEGPNTLEYLEKQKIDW
ncbi:MAG: WbqC family protein [Bacteroidota bacterium]